MDYCTLGRSGLRVSRLNLGAMTFGAGTGTAPIDRARVDPIVHELRAIAQTLEATPAQVALAWLLGREATSTVIVGARNEQQLNDNLRAAGIALTPEQRARLDRVSQPPEPYPYWMQRLHDRDRVLD